MGTVTSNNGFGGQRKGEIMNQFHASNNFDQSGEVPNRGNQRWLVAAAAAVAVASVVGVTAIGLSGGHGSADAAPAALPAQAVTETATVTETDTVTETATIAEPGVVAEPARVEPAPAADEPVAETVASPTTESPAATPTDTAPEPEGPCPTYTTDDEFPVGLCSKGETVRKIQQLLSYADPSVTVDGFYGPATEEAVKAVQSGWGVAQTGVMDRELYERTDAYYFHEDPVPELDPKLTDRQLIPASSPGFPCEYYEATEGALFPCSSGQRVVELQTALGSIGYSIDADGLYGPGTMTAVQSVQTSMGMHDTGIADEVFKDVLAQLTNTATGI